jgi:hypothetical protein
VSVALSVILKEVCTKMTINEALRGIAGIFVLISVALGIWVNPWFFAFTAFVGLNLFQSAFTRSCPMMIVLRKRGLKP